MLGTHKYVTQASNINMNLLIFEDDVIFDENIFKLYNIIRDTYLNKDLNLFYLGCYVNKPRTKHTEYLYSV